MSQELKMKRTVKDTVFRDLFSCPKYLLQLYQALHPEDTDITEQDLKIVTLQNILANGIYNDLGFLAKDKLLILVEAQSTWSPNIIIRSLIYLMSTYQEYFNENNVFLYGTRTVKMPKPELFVVYTQEKGSHPDVLSFRDTFFPNEPCCIEAKANVIYANDSDTIINQYIHFCTVLNQQVKECGLTLTAIKNTIRICKNNNMLKEYLERRETEVEDIMLTLFDQDRITELYGNERAAEGREEGRAEGMAEGMLKIVFSMLKKGRLTETEAAAEVGMSIASFRKAVAELK